MKKYTGGRNSKQIPFDKYSKPNRRDEGMQKRRPHDDYSDDVLSQFSSKTADGDDYELFVDETVNHTVYKEQKTKKAPKQKKPLTPLKRKIRRIVSYCAILTVVLIVGVVLSLTVLFKTQEYRISGISTYDEAEIIDACGISKNENIFLAPKSTAERRLIERFAYIEDVEVSFSIPDAITIDITEAVPSYIVMVSDNMYLVVSSKGRILDTTDDKRKYALPLFLGPKVTTDTVGSYIEYADSTVPGIINNIVTTFVDNGYKGITEIDATDTAMMSFTYDSRIKVKLGVPEDLSYKIRTAMTIINEKLDLNGANSTKGELDVSNCNTTKKSYFREQSLIDSQTNQKPVTVKDNNSDNYEDNDFEDDDMDLDVEPPTEKLSVEDWYVD